MFCHDICKQVRKSSSAEVLHCNAENFDVDVLPCGIFIHRNASHLGASPDGKVDPNEKPPYGQVEVPYHWHVQGLLMVTDI